MKVQKKHCAGCYNDFYNHRTNVDGKSECWSMASAKFVKVRIISVDQRPPYLNAPEQTKPSCFRVERFVTFPADRFDSQGYIKR